MADNGYFKLQSYINSEINMNYSHLKDGSNSLLYLISPVTQTKTVYINLSSISHIYRTKITKRLKYGLHFLDYSAQYLRDNYPELKGYYHRYYTQVVSGINVNEALDGIIIIL